MSETRDFQTPANLPPVLFAGQGWCQSFWHCRQAVPGHPEELFDGLLVGGRGLRNPFHTHPNSPHQPGFHPLAPSIEQHLLLTLFRASEQQWKGRFKHCSFSVGSHPEEAVCAFEPEAGQLSSLCKGKEDSSRLPVEKLHTASSHSHRGSNVQPLRLCPWPNGPMAPWQWGPLCNLLCRWRLQKQR